MKTAGNTVAFARTYASWRSMRYRCNNPDYTSYHRYGGRGITYDPRWDSFENFLADMGERPAHKTLDRIDNDGPYNKSNCRWATNEEQTLTKSTSVLIEFQGQQNTLASWARKLNIPYPRLKRRWQVHGNQPLILFKEALI